MIFSMPSPSLTLGYCTNVHPGVDLKTIRENLQQYAVGVRQQLSTGEPLGVGLWLPHQAVAELKQNGTEDFAAWLDKLYLRPFTINGFPYDNFHEPVVKHRVYRPGWWEPTRLEYTQHLAQILAAILPVDVPMGSISTLPIGWPTDVKSPELLSTAGNHFRSLAEFLSRLEASTGRRIVVAIEPEPGCCLATSQELCDWFHEQLPKEQHRRYITVCHDVCHAAVMMEPQHEVLDRYADAGIAIGKVQVSSAVVVDWQSMSNHRRSEALDQIAGFAEDRYLHQTGCWKETGEFKFVEDLPGLVSTARKRLAANPNCDPVPGDLRWTIHFHVPLFLERFGHLTTTQDAVIECLERLLAPSQDGQHRIDFSGHLEIETYAWNVLPAGMRRRGLAEDITDEFRWLQKALRHRTRMTMESRRQIPPNS
jgi:sugar phosphate isomerase/epimerase